MNIFENGLVMPYIPLLVTDTVDGKSIGGYLWEGRIVRIANEKFWEEVNRKYPQDIVESD